MAGQMKTANAKVAVATKATGNKKLNASAKVAKKAAVKFTGPKSTAPKGAVPTMKMGGSKSKKSC